MISKGISTPALAEKCSPKVKFSCGLKYQAVEPVPSSIVYFGPEIRAYQQELQGLAQRSDPHAAHPQREAIMALMRSRPGMSYDEAKEAVVYGKR